MLNCVKECIMTSQCIGVNYRYDWLMCDLLRDTKHIISETGCIFRDIATWPKVSKYCDMALDCAEVPVVNKAVSTERFGVHRNIGAGVKFKCEDGYTISGWPYSICLPSGEWEIHFFCEAEVRLSKTFEMEQNEFPVRSGMDDPNTKWRHGKPDYTVVNNKFMREKSKNHQTGSLEKTVEDLVKSWEMESSHKYDLKDWTTISKDGDFYFQVNGGKKFTGDDNVELGNYNMMLLDSPFIDVSKETHDSSHDLFKKAFPEGFPWEVLDVLSGPPIVSFTWRHWTKWTGPYKDQKPTGENIEMVGSCVAEVTSDMKIKYIQVFFDPNPVMAKLTGYKCPLSLIK
ncbi:unnamed protein product [Mytilus edulis]|uniref:Sushi domain-containing protein n=1 Tax=Mytilus edulis TaxID=6550 RepID=A0A8S3RV74_MYTED|nr:unnamed protein product [Mytilus edulis]